MTSDWKQGNSKKYDEQKPMISINTLSLFTKWKEMFTGVQKLTEKWKNHFTIILLFSMFRYCPAPIICRTNHRQWKKNWSSSLLYPLLYPFLFLAQLRKNSEVEDSYTTPPEVISGGPMGLQPVFRSKWRFTIQPMDTAVRMPWAWLNRGGLREVAMNGNIGTGYLEVRYQVPIFSA